MKILKQLFNFYINSSCHVALAIMAFSYITYLELSILPSEHVLLYVFLGSVFGYNFVKYFGLETKTKQDHPFWLKGIGIFSVLCGLGALYLIFQFKVGSIALMLFMSLLTFLYTVPLRAKKGEETKLRNLRALSGLKIFIIATVWTVTTVILPLNEVDYAFDFSVVLMGLQRFIWVLVLMIPFEIRDLKYDDPSLATIAQIFGIGGAKVIGFIGLIFIGLLHLLYVELPLTSIIFGVILLITGVGLWGANRRRSDYYSAFWIEAIPILWLTLLLIFRQF